MQSGLACKRHTKTSGGNSHFDHWMAIRGRLRGALGQFEYQSVANAHESGLMEGRLSCGWILFAGGEVACAYGWGVAFDRVDDGSG